MIEKYLFSKIILVLSFKIVLNKSNLNEVPKDEKKNYANFIKPNERNFS